MSEEPRKATDEEIENAENLIRRSRLSRQRGDITSADLYMKEAQEAAPGASVVLEAIGDDLLESGKKEKALEVFKLATEADPDNAGIERKYAECVLAVQMAGDPFAIQNADMGDYGSGKTAAILAALMPGLGHMVTGQGAKGAMILGAWALCLLIAGLLPGGFSSIGGLFNDNEVNGLALTLLALAALIHVGSFLSIAGEAKQIKPKEVERPVPPSDQDFEI
jgi:tetratricopeptide (TPR) repeat protein